MDKPIIIYVGKFFGQDERDQRIFRVVFEPDGYVGYEVANKDRMGRDKWDELKDPSVQKNLNISIFEAVAIKLNAKPADEIPF